MIKTFGNVLTEDIFHNRKTKHTRKFQPNLHSVARRKLAMINYATKIDDLLIPPANRLEKKQGDLKDYWAIRINDQWRVMFKWDGQDADDVQIIDYH